MSTTVTAQAFNRAPSAASRAAVVGPVVITNRGVPFRVLMTFHEYERLRANNLADILAMPAGHDIDFEPERLELGLRPADR